MRFVHASDWHLGRLFHGEHLTGDQAHVLEQLVTLVGESKADALIVAGDLYDRAVPPSEAVELLDETLSRLAMDVRVPVVLIAGNHDSPERVGFASRLLERSGVHVFGPVQGKPGSVVLEDEHGSVVVHAIPYTDPPQARHALGDEDIKDHDAAVRGLVASARDHAPPGPRSICVAHAFVVGGEPSESERPLSVGGSGVVAADCFTEYSYAALGHLHRPQTAGAPHVRYSGSLLKYSFSEADHAKSVSLVELDAKGQANVEEITLSPKHDVRVVTGMLADLLEGPAEGKSREDYLLVRLENREALLDVMGKLREVYPNVMHVGPERGRARGLPRDRRAAGARGARGMRPLAVEFSAFGPYPASQRLDFGQLPPGTLFLVHGPTGSGKTTILDAICFALYGDTSGKERDGGDMRCQLAAPETLTEVVLDFALGEKRLRVRRVPDQLRPKKVGEGLTEQKKEATLWPLDSTSEPGKPIASGWGKVTAALEDLIGLDSAQFRQVVLLPQGQFRKLLISDSRDREAILQRLFDTRRFRNLEDALKRQAAEMSKASDTLVTQEKIVVGQLAQGLECEGEDGAAPTRSALDGAKAALVAEIEGAASAARDAALAAKVATEALQAGEAVQARLQAFETARADEGRLAEERPQVEELRVELGAAIRARTVQPSQARQERALTANERAGGQLAAATEAEREAEAALERSAQLLKTEQGSEAEKAREAARQQVTRLRGLREVVGELSEARRAADAAARAATRAEEGETLAAEQVSRTETARKEAEADRGKASKAADGRADLVSALEKAERSEEEARQLADLRAKQASAKESQEAEARQLAEAERRLETAVASRDRLLSAFESGQAARLAESLSEGEPCPVCGSAEHPQPARAGEDLPSEDDVEAAVEAVETVRADRDAMRDAASRAAEAVRAAAGAVEEQVERNPLVVGEDLADLAAVTQAARAALDLAETAREEEQAAARRVEVLGDELEAAREALDAARAGAEAARTAAATTTAELDTKQATVPKHLRSPGALDTALAAAEAESKELSRRLDEAASAHSTATADRAAARSKRESAAGSVEESGRELRDAVRALAQALTDAGFDDLEACEGAARDAARRGELERRVEAFEKRSVASAANLARCAEAARGLEAPELEVLRAAKAQADSRRSDADERRGSLAKARESAERSFAQLDAFAEKREALEKRFGVVGNVARLAVGNNELNLSLHRFVLGALLDEVLAAASVRLARMSGGRYLLRRSSGLRDGRRAAGLDLEVEDSYSGRARPVATLSGGESFLAALALALSLAQVVQEHAGGVRLDALFIDEGFGSLDPQALEEAIETLERLGQEGGRLVGVISHVSELAQRIPTRLKVTADPRGSSAALEIG
jgi:exonuclease SbcC